MLKLIKSITRGEDFKVNKLLKLKINYTIFMIVFFVIMYKGAEFYTYTVKNVPSYFMEWERNIPFLPIFMLPYMTSAPFFLVTIFFEKNEYSLKLLMKRAIFLTVVSTIIFVLFNIAMVSLMGKSPEGKSYILATSFNWYPLLILPIVLSLLVVNINAKEKSEHIVLQKSKNLSSIKIELAKNIIIVTELFIILLISTILIFAVAIIFLGEKILLSQLVIATICLFVGSLPIVALSFLIYGLTKKKAVLILLNFVLTFPSAVIAVTKNWILFPWSYNLRMLSPVVGVHPNGTFLETGSKLMNMDATYLGLLLSIAVYVVVLILSLLINKKRSE